MPFRFSFLIAAFLCAALPALAEEMRLRLETASVAQGLDGGVVINFTMNDKSRRQFAELTTRNVGKNIRLLVDGKVMSEPRIMSPIQGGSGQISATMSFDEANRMAERLKSGSSVLLVRTAD